jgi:virginiamycin B lyase
VREGGGVVVRRGHLVALVGAFLIAVLVLGCGAGDPGNDEGRGGSRGAFATKGETTAPQGARSASRTKQEPASLNVEVVSPDHAYQPVGFGGGSLWATDIATCKDSASSSSAASGLASGSSYSVPSVDGSVAVSLASCVLPPKMLLKRLDPQSGEEVAAIPLKGFDAEILELAVGAGSVWVASEGNVVLRIDLETNRVVDRIPVGPVDSSPSLAFGHGSVWATSAGTLSRIDPETDEVVAKIEVGRGAVDIATDQHSGDVWVAGLYLAGNSSGDFSQDDSEYNKLSRVDPATNRVVAEIPIQAGSRYGGAWNVAVGEGSVWAQSLDGKLFKVHPATNEVVAKLSLGSDSSDLAVYGGSVWATSQPATGTRLVQVDPRTAHIVASEHGPEPNKGGYRGLVAGGGYVWFASGDGLARVAP